MHCAASRFPARVWSLTSFLLIASMVGCVADGGAPADVELSSRPAQEQQQPVTTPEPGEVSAAESQPITLLELLREFESVSEEYEVMDRLGALDPDAARAWSTTSARRQDPDVKALIAAVRDGGGNEPESELFAGLSDEVAGRYFDALRPLIDDLDERAAKGALDGKLAEMQQTLALASARLALGSHYCCKIMWSDGSGTFFCEGYKTFKAWALSKCVATASAIPLATYPNLVSGQCSSHIDCWGSP
ncbi:hypothetical protein BE21_54205 [Sorangium cellulosum]|uniref:Secreted protein n=1 Tax=Sorangium cellulosum TaxID=56 RepID=A0A150TDQ3_SORCE|nr:hypothetical protein BE21_54205 [Sorangium cellulosum]